MSSLTSLLVYGMMCVTHMFALLPVKIRVFLSSTCVAYSFNEKCVYRIVESILINALKSLSVVFSLAALPHDSIINFLSRAVSLPHGRKKLERSPHREKRVTSPEIGSSVFSVAFVGDVKNCRKPSQSKQRHVRHQNFLDYIFERDG